MDSDDDVFDNDNVDSGNVSSGDDEDDDFAMEVDVPNSKERQQEPEEYQYEVLTTDQIVQHMIDCINDVNVVVNTAYESRIEKTGHLLNRSNFVLVHKTGSAGQPGRVPFIETGDSPREQRLEKCIAYEVIKSVFSRRRREVTTISGLTALLPRTITRILLNHYKWDKERLMERYFDGNQEDFFREAHVINPFIKSNLVNKPKQQISTSVAEECEICFTLLPPATMTGLECGHRFCKTCWGEYLTTKIVTEGNGQSIACAAHGCDILVDDVTVTKLVTDRRVKVKYQHLITNNFVLCNRLLRWCPSVNCTYAIKVTYVDARPVRCKCGHSFCFDCGENWHDPVQCRLLRKWIKKCDDDSETSNWIAANTKECPKCNVTIEKDGGCNHMVCKNQNCKHEFCWVCLGSWEPHGSSWYNCNRFDEDEAKAARDAQEKLRSSLARYLHYYNRYINHMQSLRFENKLYASVKHKMEEMQQHNMSWIEVQFLKKAVDILCQCRQTLMYTYVFAYYLKKNNQSMIFEDNQKDLESATEKLSEYLERDITSENLADIKQKVQDKYRYCEKRRKVLLDHVHEGYEKEWWEYTD